MMTGINEQLWEFPIDHNFKVMGEAKYPLTEIVTRIIKAEIAEYDGSEISIKNSRNGKYHSLTAVVRITRKEQLEAIYQAFGDCDEIKWTL